MKAVIPPKGMNHHSFILKFRVMGKYLLTKITRINIPNTLSIVDWSSAMKSVVPKTVNGIAPIRKYRLTFQSMC